MRRTLGHALLQRSDALIGQMATLAPNSNLHAPAKAMASTFAGNTRDFDDPGRYPKAQNQHSTQKANEFSGI